MHLPRPLWWPVLAMLACLLPAVAGAGPEPASAAPPADAREWLARIHAAAWRGNYRGTMVFTAGGAMSSSRVWHYCVGEQSFEQLEALDGRQQRIYRAGDEVHTVWPQARLVVVEKRDAQLASATTPQAVEPQALEQYELKPEGSSRVAGRDTLVFVLEPRDDLRYAQRLWADKASGLMLRADVLAPGNAGARGVLESTAFSEVEIGGKPPAEAKSQAVPRFEGYQIQRPMQQRTQLEAEGWVLARPVPGFKLSGCMKRSLDATAGDAAPQNKPVLQAMFTDGLAHVSLFVEPVDGRAPRSEAQTRLGATATVVLRRNEHWITAVGDAPVATLRLIADALERRR
jgi:sigma-E factor negative regulatory protein RseB